MAWHWARRIGIAAATVSTACGPSERSSPDTDRELLVYELSDDEDFPGGSFTLALVRPDGARTSLPFEATPRYIANANWGLDGDLLLATNFELDIIGWSSGDTDREQWRPSAGGIGFVDIDVADDPRYAALGLFGYDDVYNMQREIWDLAEQRPLYFAYSCGEAASYFEWRGSGPDAVTLQNTCEGLGEVTGYALYHHAAGESTRLFEYPPDEPPKLALSSDGERLYLGESNRWQIYDLVAGRVVIEQPAAPPVGDARWSATGDLFRVEGSRLQRLDASGVEIWAVELGFPEGRVLPSPRGDRLLVQYLDCPAGHCMAIVDVEDGSVQSFDGNEGPAAWWSPEGDSLVATGPRTSSTARVSEFLWIDASTGDRRVMPTQCWAPIWSPDHQWVVCGDACPDDDLARVRLLDAQGNPVTQDECRRHAAPPQWSPDSDVLAISEYEGDLPQQEDRVLLLDLDATAYDLGPGFLPRGAWRPGPVR